MLSAFLLPFEMILKPLPLPQRKCNTPFSIKHTFNTRTELPYCHTFSFVVFIFSYQKCTFNENFVNFVKRKVLIKSLNFNLWILSGTNAALVRDYFKQRRSRNVTNLFRVFTNLLDELKRCFRLLDTDCFLLGFCGFEASKNKRSSSVT